ncbi:MAG: DNA polymerase III subunit delta, partial [bacterium]
RVGNNLRVIVNELDKIILNLTGKKKIEVKDVQKVVGLTRKFSVFDLNDAIGYKDLEKALVILNHMLESGESPTGILAMIARHFINLNKLKGVVTQNKSKDEMSTLTGIPPFFIQKSLEMATNYSAAQLQHIFESLLEKDLILKTSQQPPAIALQSLLIQIIQNGVGAKAK